MKKYNIINNTLGWIVFAVALVTYLLTIEPTASFWDCPEFIAQGFKSEIGHPPGNPIFILAARFAANFAGGDITKVSACVNAMSGVFSALTILLLFWTITHLAKKLLVTDGEEDQMTVTQYIVIMGCGVAGALAYTWSDTFWYSAVEAEVYAFSSFCTALVFWLVLKWENRATEPDSDRWLILIAYILGLSLGVHLLNLLCIPAIALVYYYKNYSNTTAKGSLITLAVSFVIIMFILYGLEPGFVSVSQRFELLFVNVLGMPFNSGVIAYAILLVALLAWNIYELYTGKNDMRIKVSFLLAVLLSGALFISSNLIVWLVLIAALCFYLFNRVVPRRLLTNVSMSILVIFIGFASYGLILIRSNANTPLDENSPNNVFELAKYLSREQYGETPLFYGRTYRSELVYQDTSSGGAKPKKSSGWAMYAQKVKENPNEPDEYIKTGNKEKYEYVSAQNMLFPRIHSEGHAAQYEEWLGLEGTQVEGVTRVDQEGKAVVTENLMRPTMMENLRWFIDYQVNYMYWRYFMWNFAGRQNDIQGMGEINNGNWISGIPVIDNMRLGDQSLLPPDMGSGNAGHNVFYMLPLLLGIVGLLWQAYRGKKGIEQFWVIFFLFFMTGLAIVLYLNQTPSQPRERDYAYAGSFYAFAIWIGLGVAGLWRMLLALMGKVQKCDAEAVEPRKSLAMACIAAIVGLAVPLQMVSQTWDDHDRSGRYCARDFGMNYLSSLDKDAIIFTNGDNDTFPLWYAQEVENYRTDVRVVNLSYLSTDWYIRQMQRAAYDSKPLPMKADGNTFSYDGRQYNYFITPDTSTVMPVLKSLEHLYSNKNMDNIYGLSELRYPRCFIPVNADDAIKAGVIPAEERDRILDFIPMNLQSLGSGMTASQVMSLDYIASSIDQGWKRPCYFAMTVPESYYLGLSPYMRNTGLAFQVTPVRNDGGVTSSACDKMYDNVMNKFRWGGLDTAEPGSLYLDETIRRMVSTHRTAITELATDLANEGALAQRALDLGVSTYMGRDAKAFAADRFKKAYDVLEFMHKKLPVATCPYGIQMGQQIASAYEFIGRMGKNPAATKRAIEVLESEILRYADYARYYQSLSPSMSGRITNIDRFIDQRYFPEIIMDYGSINPKGVDALMSKVEAKGVNLERVAQYMQRIEAARNPQPIKAAPADSDAAQASN
ncbi:MAG: DUF2723 domain-containing protein [Muribaculaceae bacterium]|nr:DUF2723 domain-containing protein [Muribaculaceae bacterium]MCF0181995.1 DUF2723 domain-containing protein [Muribaculaceae bacterium]